MTSDDDQTNESDDTITDYVKQHLNRFVHVYILAVVFIFTIVTRFQGYQILRGENGGWEFVGNDAWYHLRATMYSVENYPRQIGFDAKTGYPEGANPGAFGTLYDFVHATVSMIVGLGDPSPETVETVLAVSSPILSAFTIVAAFLLARYITDSRLAGILAAVITSLIPGSFYTRGVVGFAQHHIAEVLLLVLSLHATMKLIEKAEEDLILSDLVRNKEWSELRDWGKYLGVSIVLLFTYYLVWPPAIMFFGLIGISGVIYAVLGFGSKSTQPALFSFTVLTGSMLLITLVSLPSMNAQIASPSILHVGVAGISFIFNLFSWLLTKKAGRSNWSISYFLGGLTGLTVISTVVAFLVSENIFGRVISQLLRLFGYPFGIGGGNVQTIAEERSTSIINLIFSQYGLMLPLAIGAIVAIMVESSYRRGKNESFGKETLLVFVSLFILVISVRTVRFNYYLGPIVGVLAAVALLRLVRFVEVPSELKQVRFYHMLALLLVAVLIIPVLIVPVQGGVVYQDAISERTQDSYQQWEEPLDWLSDNSPSDGIGQYEPTSEPYEYSNESYGVMSWWDYGHWITATGERTPVANPFQQNAENAARYLLAQNPEEAESVIDEMDEDAEVRYIAIDWQMASPISKYPAMEEWHPELEQGDSHTRYYTTPPGQRPQLEFLQANQIYYESMIGRLYVGHGSAMEPSRRTVDYSTTGNIRIIQPSINPVINHNSTEEAVSYANNNTEVSRGGIINSPSERVEAMEQYRLVKTSQGRSFNQNEIAFELSSVLDLTDLNATDVTNDVPSTVKLFEKVDGADIQGSGAEPNSTLTVEVDVQDPVLSPIQNSEFTYTQRVETDEDGNFSLTVPYSTTGFENAENPPEVRGSSEYRIIDSDGDTIGAFNVSENAVIEDEEPITVSIDS